MNNPDNMSSMNLKVLINTEVEVKLTALEAMALVVHVANVFKGEEEQLVMSRHDFVIIESAADKVANALRQHDKVHDILKEKATKQNAEEADDGSN